MAFSEHHGELKLKMPPSQPICTGSFVGTWEAGTLGGMKFSSSQFATFIGGSILASRSHKSKEVNHTRRYTYKCGYKISLMGLPESGSLPSAKWFAECFFSDTRQSRVPKRKHSEKNTQ
jgi:hypothetical protein